MRALLLPYQGSSGSGCYGNVGIRSPLGGWDSASPLPCTQWMLVGDAGSASRRRHLSGQTLGAVGGLWRIQSAVKGAKRRAAATVLRDARGMARGGSEAAAFWTQGRAEDKSGASRQGMCLGTESGAQKVMGTLRFSGDCSVCVCLWPQLVTQAVYLWGQAGSLLRLPAVC